MRDLSNTSAYIEDRTSTYNAHLTWYAQRQLVGGFDNNLAFGFEPNLNPQKLAR